MSIPAVDIMEVAESIEKFPGADIAYDGKALVVSVPAINADKVTRILKASAIMQWRVDIIDEK